MFAIMFKDHLENNWIYTTFSTKEKAYDYFAKFQNWISGDGNRNDGNRNYFVAKIKTDMEFDNDFAFVIEEVLLEQV